MICDYQTNKVYLAEGIKGYPKVAENLLFWIPSALKSSATAGWDTTSPITKMWVATESGSGCWSLFL